MTLFSVFLNVCLRLPAQKCMAETAPFCRAQNALSASFSKVNKVQRKGITTSAKNRPHHGFHLVDPSPWPALTRLCMLWLTVSLVLFFHQYAGAGTSLIGALIC